MIQYRYHLNKIEFRLFVFPNNRYDWCVIFYLQVEFDCVCYGAQMLTSTNLHKDHLMKTVTEKLYSSTSVFTTGYKTTKTN